MPEYRTPGVYIVEKNAFPSSVVAVATAMPAFIGYTEKATLNGQDLTGRAVQITSMGEFETCFGGPPATLFGFANGRPEMEPESRFLLAQSMRFFFANGGGPCFIVSIGGYRDAAGAWRVKAAGDFDPAWSVLEKEYRATMVVTPDAVLLSRAGWAAVANAALAHCAALGSRIAILDVHDGHRARTRDDEDVISGQAGFRAGIAGTRLDLGAAYYPWVNTAIIGPGGVDHRTLTPAARTALAPILAKEFAAGAAAGMKRPPEAVAAFDALLAQMSAAEPVAAEAGNVHNALAATSPGYAEVMRQIRDALNVMPPAAALAGVYAMTDNAVGVFKAPANVSLATVVSPTVAIAGGDEEDLNRPAGGKAVNAIRTFPGRGNLVWGARTLDANNAEWRYINVRRTLIMLEQSIIAALGAYCFEPHTVQTWTAVRSMVENFLTNQWKAGALVGSTPVEAFHVSIGLGTTMTAADVESGRMIMVVGLAMLRPAEFTILSISQQMQPG